MKTVSFAVGVLCALACRPGSDGGGVVQGTVDAPDGVTVAYDIRGTGDTALMFVHCWACDRSFWRGQLDAFAAGYRVVALDLPGHGESGTGRTNWSIAELGADVQSVAEALDLDNVILVGHSLGGPVVLDAGAGWPVAFSASSAWSRCTTQRSGPIPSRTSRPSPLWEQTLPGA